LLADLRGDLRGDTAVPLYRIRFRRVEEPDPRDLLAGNAAMSGAELAKLTARLARMDAADSRGPWTTAILTQIADYPGTVSTVLAEELGWPRPDFKQHVRRLKELGLTISLDIGYRLSPRGEAYLNQVRGASSDASSSA
jgi:biotin operon repressor